MTPASVVRDRVAVRPREPGAEARSQLVGVGLPVLTPLPLDRLGAGGDTDGSRPDESRQTEDLPEPHGSVLYP